MSKGILENRTARPGLVALRPAALFLTIALAVCGAARAEVVFTTIGELGDGDELIRNVTDLRIPDSKIFGTVTRTGIDEITERTPTGRFSRALTDLRFSTTRYGTVTTTGMDDAFRRTYSLPDARDVRSVSQLDASATVFQSIVSLEKSSRRPRAGRPRR